MSKGIYKITNNRTGETYIGQTNNLERRKNEHMEELKQGIHHNRGMQTDYNRGDRFTFTVLEEVKGNRYNLHEKEKDYINRYNSFYRGYNQTPGGEFDSYKGRYMNGGGRKVNYTSNYNNSYNSSSNNSSSSDNFDGLSVICCIGLFLLLLIGALL